MAFKRDEAWLRKCVKDKFELLKTYRVENLQCDPGMPDIHFLMKEIEPLKSVSGWIELKVVNSDGSTIKWRPGQIPWLRDYWKNGGNSFALIYDNDMDQFWLIPGDMLDADRKCLLDYVGASYSYLNTPMNITSLQNCIYTYCTLINKLIVR